MSADNGIYILALKDQARVIHAQAIDNLHWSFETFDCEREIIATRVVEYFGDAPAQALSEAQKTAAKMEREIRYVEYGTSVIPLDMTWAELLAKAKALAIKEIAAIDKRNKDNRWSHDKASLEKLLAA